MDERCGFVGFSPRFTCLLEPGHEGLHNYGFLPTLTKSIDRTRRDVKLWEIKQVRPSKKGDEARYDVVEDRRPVGYDLDLQSAVALVHNDRRFIPGDRITVVDHMGRPESLA